MINNNLITTCNDGMKFCRPKVPWKRQFNAYKILSPRQQCRSQIPFKDFIICSLITSVSEYHQLFLSEVIEGRKSRHLSNLKVIFLLPE